MTWLKSIFLALLLTNVAYFLWARGIATKPPAATDGVSLPTLTLVSEASASQRAALAADTATGAGVAITGGAITGAAGAGTANAAVAGTANAAGAAADLAGTSADDSAAAGAGAASGAGAGGIPRADAAHAGTVLAGPAPRAGRCVSIGPFQDVSEAAHAAATLRSGGYDPRQRVADGDVWAGVWVYVPRPSSTTEVDKVLSRLKAGGIDDALEMPGPDDASVISLGLYSEPKRAQARVAQAVSLGFDPTIADRKRTGNVYWVDIDLKPTDGPLSPADLQSETGRIVRLEVKSCPPAAGSAP